MTPTSRPLRPILWVGGPMMLCIVGTLSFALPLRVATSQLPEPVFGLVPAFAWAVIRPSVAPPLALLVLGLFQDLLWGTPLGLWALCLLGLHAVILLARASLSGQSFWVLWGWYGIGCALAFGIGAAFETMAAGTVPNLLGVVAQWLVSAALYPLANLLIDRYEDADVRFR